MEIRSWTYRHHRRAGFQTGDSPGAGHQLGDAAGRLLVALCSKQTMGGQIAERASTMPAARASSSRFMRTGATRNSLLKHPAKHSGLRTSAEQATHARNAYRTHAGALAWLEQIAFLDDDITISRPGQHAHLAAQLGRHQVAGRLFASIPTILMCAGLGVHCTLPPSFFPEAPWKRGFPWAENVDHDRD
jgi:hypothetical protein